MARRLETAVNVAILLTCVIVVFVSATRLWNSGRTSLPPKNPQVLYPGESLPPVVDFNLGAAQRTLLLYLKADCQYCTLSLPFYRRLARETRLQGSGRVQLSMVTSDSRETATEYSKVNSLGGIGIVSIPPQLISRLKLPGTPTLVLVDSRGTVNQVWLGQLDATREEEVVQALFPDRDR